MPQIRAVGTILSVVFLCFTAEFSAGAGFGSLEEVTILPGLEGTTLVLRGSKLSEHRAFRLTDPDRVVVDLIGVQRTVELKEQVVSTGAVKGIRVAQFAEPPQPVVRVVADLRGASNYSVESRPDELVIQLTPLHDNQPQQAVPPLATRPDSRRDVVPRLSIRSPGNSDGVVPLALDWIDTVTTGYKANNKGSHDPQIERRTAILAGGLKTHQFDTEDSRAKTVLGIVHDAFVDGTNQDGFLSLLNEMLNNGNSSEVVNYFCERASQAQYSWERLRDKIAALKKTGKEVPTALDSSEVYAAEKMDSFASLCALAHEANTRWREPKYLEFLGLPSRVVVRDAVYFQIRARNKKGVETYQPSGLVLAAVPPDAAELDWKELSVSARRPGQFLLRAQTPDGQLLTEQAIIAAPRPEGEPLIAEIEPRGGVLERKQYVQVTVTANAALQRHPWDVIFEDSNIITGQPTYQDSGKSVFLLRGLKSGAGNIVVRSEDRLITEAKFFVRPSPPSKKLPTFLSTLSVAALATALSIKGDHPEVAAFLGLNVSPLLGVGAAMSWEDYLEDKRDYEDFLKTVPVSVDPKPIALRLGPGGPAILVQKPF